MGGTESPFWTVDLGSPELVGSLMIVSRNGGCNSGPCPDRLHTIEVRVGNSAYPHENSLCYANAGVLRDGLNYIKCGGPVAGRYFSVQIMGEGNLTLCEVEVYQACEGIQESPKCLPQHNLAFPVHVPTLHGRSLHASVSSMADFGPRAYFLGDVEVVYNWQRDHCPKHADLKKCQFLFKPIKAHGLDCDGDVVDAPPKAFRRPSRTNSSLDEVVLLGSHYHGSRAQIGPTLDTVKHNCHVYYDRPPLLVPELFAMREWIQSPWAFANGTVIALTHMQSHCIKTVNGIFSAITLLSSYDGGHTWDRALPPPAHVVAAVT
eukprot:gene4587-14772_t